MSRRRSRARRARLYDALGRRRLARLRGAHASGSLPRDAGTPVRALAARTPAVVAFGRSVAREAEKKAIETARYVIPIACHTAMVYTVSGIVLHRLRRMARRGRRLPEASDVVERMVAEVERLDPSLLPARWASRPSRRTRSWSAARVRRGSAIPPRSRPSTSPSTVARARLVDYGLRGRRRWSPTPCVTCSAAAIWTTTRPSTCVLDPGQESRTDSDGSNVSTHAPLMRTLAHAHYTFRKKLSHSGGLPGPAPSDGSGLATPAVADGSGVRGRGGARADRRGSRLPRPVPGARRGAWDVAARLLALERLPSSPSTCCPTPWRSVSRNRGACSTSSTSGRMRTCLNAQREIWRGVDGRDRAGPGACIPSWCSTSVRPARARPATRVRAAPREPTSAACRSGGASPTHSGGI